MRGIAARAAKNTYVQSTMNKRIALAGLLLAVSCTDRAATAGPDAGPGPTGHIAIDTCGAKPLQPGYVISPEGGNIVMGQADWNTVKAYIATVDAWATCAAAI